MLNKVYSVFDTKGLMYNVPFFAAQNGVAIRMFTELVNDGRSTISRFPDDFILFEIGTFDDSNGKVVSLPEPIALGHASGYLKSKESKSVEVVR